MSIIQGNAHTSAGGGYNIERSLRFNSADSAYLNRTPASAGNLQTWTWSAWVKRSGFATNPQRLFYTGNSNDNETNIYFSVDRLAFEYYVAPTNYYVVSSTVFRDPSAWYHFVVVSDTTNATSSDRMRIYVNGSRITNLALSSYPAQNANLTINSAAAHYIGQRANGTQIFDGYMTEINFIGGQALTPSDFGETDSATGVWKPKAFSGTYGTNGFYLKFADNSGTTSTTLGKDSSGNGNNWTPNNFSVTAGAGNDSLVDTPTNYGTDSGLGAEVRGNYATFNALTTTGNTLTNGNLDAAAAAAAWRGSFSTIGVSSGKWYMEFTIVGGTFARQIIGIALNSAVNSASFYGYGYVSGSQFMGRSVGAIPVDYSSGTLTSLSPTTDFDNGDVVGLCIDADAGKLWVFKNNTIIEGTVNGTANVTWTANSLVFPVASMYSGDSVYANFGQRAFAYTAPSGFKALCTQNLPTPTIGTTSTTQANDYFDVTTYSGQNTSLTVTNSGSMQPDFVWIKSRNTTDYHNLTDAVRGTSKNLFSNTTDAEDTVARLTSFNSNGVTLAGGYGYTNISGQNYVAWQWRASNTTAVTNTAGSITSTVSANTTAGFSIVTYTGTGSSPQSIGHGLGATPAMIILKSRSATSDWYVNHVSIGTNDLRLNSTGASAANNFFSAKSSTTFTINFNQTGDWVAYCFAAVAGYSAFGSYTGNGSADGVFVYTGFRPRYVMVKRTDSTGAWVIWDSARDTYNVAEKALLANASNAEDTTNYIDFLSNGFKLRNTFGSQNGSGATYIYMALAENPFKYSLGR